MIEQSIPVVGNTANPIETTRQSTAAITRAFATPQAFVDVGHSQLAYYTFGEGPDVVFCHGWPIHSATFRKILPALIPHFKCHLLDLPGAGKTRITAATPIELEAHADTMRRAIDRLGLSEFAWLAHDSGGVVARIAAADDRRVRGMVIGGTEIPGYTPWVIRMYAALSKVPGTISAVGAMMRVGAIRRLAIGFGGCFTDPAYVDGEFGELFVAPMLGSPEVMRRHMQLMQTLDFGVLERLVDVHARIRAPVRLIWGTEDPFFPIARARTMAAEFAGGAELVEIEGAKLFPQEDHPEAFAAHALGFLRKCFADAST